jgi:hypothetical protein
VTEEEDDDDKENDVVLVEDAFIDIVEESTAPST